VNSVSTKEQSVATLLTWRSQAGEYKVMSSIVERAVEFARSKGLLIERTRAS
jgi:hypothetical protein